MHDLQGVVQKDEVQLHELANFKASSIFGAACDKLGGTFQSGIGSCVNLKGGKDYPFQPPYPVP